MGVLDRQPYLEKIRQHDSLTEEQKREIIDNVVQPALLALERAMGLAVLICQRLNHKYQQELSAEQIREIYDFRK
jgi:hypothetical protein